MQSTDSADGSHSGLRASRPEPRSNSPGTSPQAAEEAVSRPSGLLILSARLWFGRPWGVDIASRAAVNRRRCIRCSLVVRPDLAARIAAVVIHPRILADGFQKSARPAAFRAIVDGHCWHQCVGGMRRGRRARAAFRTEPGVTSKRLTRT
jgi:hypothetical protein